MEFQIPKIVHEEVNENRGVFVIEPLDRGFGYTFGNSLRRVLLSSLEGAAVTSVKIEGVSHEFTTIPGVREDVTDIILNLKSMICVLHGESPEIEVRMSARGTGEVTAGDIEAPADLEILNPDLVLANLSDKGRLDITLTIGRGRGYAPTELSRGSETTIGVIPIDAIFSPVRRVAFSIEPTRVEQATNYDRLTVEIETDGSITPRDALASAADTLRTLVGLVADLSDEPRGLELGEVATTTSSSPDLELAIEDLDLSERPRNCLKRARVDTIGQLVQKTEDDLLAITNFGSKSLEEVMQKLDERGLSLRVKE